jgi:predicted  nucleic acid-binding Zn-ribbon protein
MVSQDKKITQEELDTLVLQQKDLNSLLTNIGILESQKHGFLHQIADVNKGIEDFKEKLQDKYGFINIDLKDGSYTEVESFLDKNTLDK